MLVNRSGEQPSHWDHGTHQDFYDYYAATSESEAALQRFQGIQATVLRIAAETGMGAVLDVADIGCGAGTQARLWAEGGHRVFGLDVNEPLVSLAKRRAVAEGMPVTFEVGTATALPWLDETMDVCLLPELLEHVTDWQSCLKEAARVLRPGGLLYLSTTNVLCPRQDEFHLPLYSWYPSSLKRYCERLATSTRPALAGYAKYPAIHWFSYYSLRRFLRTLGFDRCLDRFELIDTRSKSTITRAIVAMTCRTPVLRFLGHVATPSTYLVALKTNSITPA